MTSTISIVISTLLQLGNSCQTNASYGQYIYIYICHRLFEFLNKQTMQLATPSWASPCGRLDNRGMQTYLCNLKLYWIRLERDFFFWSYSKLKSIWTINIVRLVIIVMNWTKSTAFISSNKSHLNNSTQSVRSIQVVVFFLAFSMDKILICCSNPKWF